MLFNFNNINNYTLLIQKFLSKFFFENFFCIYNLLFKLFSVFSNIYIDLKFI